MQILEFAEVLSEVVARLRLQEVKSFLEPILVSDENVTVSTDRRETFSRLAFEVSNATVALQADSKFQPAVSLLGLTHLLTPTVLARLVTAFRTAQNTHEIRFGQERLYFWQLYVSARSFVELAGQVQSLLVEPKLAAAGPDETVLQLEIIDYDGNGIDIARLQYILRSLNNLYATITRALGEQSELRVAYGDSGSDFGLGIVGRALGMEVIRSLFRDGWRHVRFWKETGFERRLEALGKGLEFVADVRMRAAAGQLQPEDAKRLEHVAVTEMGKLMGAGVALREPESYAPVPRRELISAARDVRMLSAGDSSDPDSTRQDEQYKPRP